MLHYLNEEDDSPLVPAASPENQKLPDWQFCRDSWQIAPMGTEPTAINCMSRDWRADLKSALQDGLEVDLKNFDYTIDGALCEALAQSHDMVFRLNAAACMGHFRKKPAKPKPGGHE